MEIGRKIRAPQDEETGVETYSKLWGASAAARSWLIALAIAGLCATLAATAYGWLWPIGLLSAAGAAAAAVVALRYPRQPAPRRAKLLESYSALWTLVLYTAIGIVPGLLSAWAW